MPGAAYTPLETLKRITAMYMHNETQHQAKSVTGARVYLKYVMPPTRGHAAIYKHTCTYLCVLCNVDPLYPTILFGCAASFFCASPSSKARVIRVATTRSCKRGHGIEHAKPNNRLQHGRCTKPHAVGHCCNASAIDMLRSS